MHKLLVCCYLSYLNFVQILLMQPLSWILWPSVVLTAAHSLGKSRRKAWSIGYFGSWDRHQRADSDDQRSRAYRIIKHQFFCRVWSWAKLNCAKIGSKEPLHCNDYHGIPNMSDYMISDAMRCAGRKRGPTLLYHNANERRCNYESIRNSEQH